MIFPGTPGRFSDCNHALCSNVGKGPKGDGIIADVVRDDPYGVYRIQFKNSKTGEVYLTTPNMDPGSRIYFCMEELTYESDDSYVVPFDVFSPQQAGTIRDARVGDIVFYKLHKAETFGTNAIGIGIITNISLQDQVTFMQHAVLDIGNIEEIDMRIQALQEATNAIQETLDALPSYEEFVDLDSRVNAKGYTFNTTAEMKQSTLLKNGDICETLGFHTIGDGGAACYKITNVANANEMDVLSCANNLFATLIVNTKITPEMFGAYSNGVNDDSTYFQRVCTYIQEHTHSDMPTQGVYQAIAPIIELVPNRKYVLNSTINIYALRFVIKGNGARIISTADTVLNFKASSGGWVSDISGLSFFECNNPIKFDYYNLEAGFVTIHNCRFDNCHGIAIDISKQSTVVIIEKNIFEICDKTLSARYIDRLYFKNNWVSGYSFTADDEAAIYSSCDSATISENLFVPYPTTYDCSWIRTTQSCHIDNNRFGGESGSIRIVDYAPSERTLNEQTVLKALYFTNNDVAVSVAKSETIRISGQPEKIVICGNTGLFLDNTGSKYLVNWNSDITSEAQDTILNRVGGFLRITYSDNSGGFLGIYGITATPAGSSNKLFPANLRPYINADAFTKMPRASITGGVLTITSSQRPFANSAQVTDIFTPLIVSLRLGGTSTFEIKEVCGVLSYDSNSSKAITPIFTPIVNTANIQFEVTMTPTLMDENTGITFTIKTINSYLYIADARILNQMLVSGSKGRRLNIGA